MGKPPTRLQKNSTGFSEFGLGRGEVITALCAAFRVLQALFCTFFAGAGAAELHSH